MSWPSSSGEWIAVLHGYILEVENLAEFPVLLRVHEIDFHSGAVPSVVAERWSLSLTIPRLGLMTSGQAY